MVNISGSLQATTWVKRESEQQYKDDFAAGRTLGGAKKGGLPSWGSFGSNLGGDKKAAGKWKPKWMQPEPEPEPEPEIEIVSTHATCVCVRVLPRVAGVSACYFSHGTSDKYFKFRCNEASVAGCLAESGGPTTLLQNEDDISCLKR